MQHTGAIPSITTPSRSLAALVAGLLAGGLLLSPADAQANCEEPQDLSASTPSDPEPSWQTLVPFNATRSTDTEVLSTGKNQLTELLRTALVTSSDSKSAEHTRAAAQFDLEQTRAGKSPQVSVNSAFLGVGQNTGTSGNTPTRLVSSLGLTMTAPLYDAGRVNSLIQYREQLFGASDNSMVAIRERVAREALLAALERNRAQLQVKIYQQFVAKLACLSRSIEVIVQADPGRASEQVQARKSLRMVEISRDEAQTALRHAEAKLQRLLGDKQAMWSAIGVPLTRIPELERVKTQIHNSPEVLQLRSQADALSHLAKATRAEQAPQLRWQASANSSHSAYQTTANSWNAGVTLNYTWFDGGGQKAAASAAQERAEAARKTWEQTLTDRLQQAQMLHDAATSAYQRAERYSTLLRDSDTLRNATYVQWIKLGRRSLFDLISAESEYYQLRLSYVSALHDGFSATTQLRATGEGLLPWVAPELISSSLLN